jgi:hypothetical protein
MDFDLDGHGSIPASGKFFLYYVASRPALGPTQARIQWVPGVLSPGVKWPRTEVKNGLTIPPVLGTSSWRGAYKHRDNLSSSV